MKLQQLRFIREVARCGLNVSAAAESLFTAQPGVSNQIRLLEDELDVQIFERNGKRLVGLTEPGKAILNLAERVLKEVDNIRKVGAEFSNNSRGTLSIATTHTQARYALPSAVVAFRERYPEVRLQMHQGNPTQVAELAVSGVADIAIATEGIALYEDLIMLPGYKWRHIVIARYDHPILLLPKLTLAAIANYPIITYDFAFAGRTKINQAFENEGLTPNIVLTALDSDVIKTYVKLGLGIGLIADLAFEPARDHELRAMDTEHLFESSMTRIGIRKGMYMRGFMFDFIELFAPHLNRETVEKAMAG